MKDEKISQNQANKNWEEKNKEYSNYLKSRSAARSFVRNKATIDDLNELEQLIAERRNVLPR